MYTPPPPSNRSGIRLYPGDCLSISTKAKVSPDTAAIAIAESDLIFTVTESKRGPGNPFLRVKFDCPRGIFVSTYRLNPGERDTGPAFIPERPVSQDCHQTLKLARDVGQSIRLRPADSSRVAAHDLYHHHIIIEPFFYYDDLPAVGLKIHATKSWTILRDEIAEPRRPGVRTADEDVKAQIWQQAFIAAARDILSADQFSRIANEASKRAADLTK